MLLRLLNFFSAKKGKLMAHSIGSIREMVRQYREELSFQPTSNDVPLCFDSQKRASCPNEGRHAGTKRLKNKKHVYWHDSSTGSACSVMQERTGTGSPLRFGTDGLKDFQDLDGRAREVLRRSQQVIGGQACNSSAALISKSGQHVDYIQAPSYFMGNGHNSPYASGTAERRSHKNRCRGRDVVARNFEEIDQILGESNLIMEQSFSSDVEHDEASDYTKVGNEMLQASKESGFEPGHGLSGDEFPYPGAEDSKQDMEAREEAAIKAANYYLNKGNGPSNVRSERLLDNPLACTKTELASTCRRSLSASGGSVGSADQACHPSTFNTNKHQEWQTTNPLALLESCQGTKICDKSVPITSSITPIIHSKIKWPKSVEGDRPWSHHSRQLNSETVDFSSMMNNKGTWKYAAEINFGEDHLNGMKSVELDCGLAMSSGNSASNTTRQRPSTVDSKQYQFSTNLKSMNMSLKIRDICSTQTPVSHTAYFGQELGAHNPDVLGSERRSCTGRLVRGASHGSLCLEDDMMQLSTEDLLLALENPRKARENLSQAQFDDSCEAQRTYQPKKYLSPEKCSMSPTATEFESSFAGDLNEKDEESTTRSAILAIQPFGHSLERDYEEIFDWTGSRRNLLKSNLVQRSKVSHCDPATQLLCSSAKYRGTKDKDVKSPAWMQSLNVRKPTKWRATSITHSRLQAPAANLIKDTVVEELEESALGHTKPTGRILAAAVNSESKERAQEDFDCSATTASISNNNSVIDYRRQAGNHIPDPIDKKTTETRRADISQASHMFSARVSKQITNGAAQTAETTTLFEQAGRQVETSFAHCSGSCLNQRNHGGDDLAKGISLPRVLTLRENHRVTNNLVAQEDSHFDNLLTNSTFFPGLDYLISEVVHEWAEICSTPSPASSAYGGSQELSTVSPTSCSTAKKVSTNCPLSEDGSSPEKALEIKNRMQVSNAGKWLANQNHFTKVQGSKSLPRDCDLVKDVRKTSVAALVSVVQPLLAALQEAQIEESIVKEFEADETVRLLLEKLQFYETKIRALKDTGKNKDLTSAEDEI